MKGLLIRWIVQSLALGITAWIVKGITVSGMSSLLIAALCIGILNAVVRPVMIFMTLPLNLLTMGLFTFVINALMLLLAAEVVSGFSVHGFLAGLIGSILLSVVSFFLNKFVGIR